MKNKIFIIPFLLLFLPAMAVASEQAHLFEYDKDAVEETFSQLDQLESQITLQTGINNESLSGKSLMYSDLTGITASSVPVSPLFGINDMDWGAFAWGFLCCPVGFFVIANNKTKPQRSKTSYWIGVIASSVLSTISTIASGAGSMAVTL